MDWFQNKTGQLIALAAIVSTLAGFGYTGATYVNIITIPDATMTAITTATHATKATHIVQCIALG